MIGVNDLRKGVTFEFDDRLYKVLDYHHNKPGRGNATIRIKAVDLRSGTTLEKTFQTGEPIDVDLPITVDRDVVESEVAVRGDTATGVYKKVKTGTGLEVQVPAFVNIGDRIRIDTRTGSYVTRG